MSIETIGGKENSSHLRASGPRFSEGVGGKALGALVAVFIYATKRDKTEEQKAGLKRMMKGQDPYDTSPPLAVE